MRTLRVLLVLAITASLNAEKPKPDSALCSDARAEVEWIRSPIKRVIDSMGDDLRQFAKFGYKSGYIQGCKIRRDGLVWGDPCKCICGLVGGGTDEGYEKEDSVLAGRAEASLCEIPSLLGYFDYPERDRYRNRIVLAISRAELRRRTAVMPGVREVALVEVAK